jgi:ribosomal protein L15
MAKRGKARRASNRAKSRGPRGNIGPRGKRGPRGPAGSTKNHMDVVRLSAQMNEVLKELQVQLTRIAQLQGQLDRLAAGEPPQFVERRATKRTSH